MQAGLPCKKGIIQHFYIEIKGSDSGLATTCVLMLEREWEISLLLYVWAFYFQQ